MADKKKQAKAQEAGKPKVNNPVTRMMRDPLTNMNPGDNAQFIEVSLQIMNMPTIDMKDVDQVNERLNDFFAVYAANDMKPTVAGMALALNNMTRQQLWAICHDRPTGGHGYKPAILPEVANVIKKAYKILEVLWESYSNSGKMNPVTAIFLAKNHFGYRDQTEIVVEPRENGSDYDETDIAKRYLEERAPVDAKIVAEDCAD